MKIVTFRDTREIPAHALPNEIEMRLASAAHEIPFEEFRRKPRREREVLVLDFVFEQMVDVNDAEAREDGWSLKLTKPVDGMDVVEIRDPTGDDEISPDGVLGYPFTRRLLSRICTNLAPSMVDQLAVVDVKAILATAFPGGMSRTFSFR